MIPSALLNPVSGLQPETALPSYLQSGQEAVGASRALQASSDRKCIATKNVFGLPLAEFFDCGTTVIDFTLHGETTRRDCVESPEFCLHHVEVLA